MRSTLGRAMNLSETALTSCNGSSTLTSRISVQKLCMAVAQFSQFKRDLAKETGFGGMLEMKIMHKTNLKFSSFLMERVDLETSTLLLDIDRVIQITDKDVQDVFGLPIGTRSIPICMTDMSDACIEFSRLAASHSTKGIHSLKAAEMILGMHVDANSTKLQKDCFKIAFVIFSVGHVLNPSAKHDYTSVDYWAALAVPSEKNSFNWCRYVRDSLMKGVPKLKADIINRHSTIQIIGCHLLLQVNVLDKFDQSSKCIPQQIYPRIQVFDNLTMKKAIDALSDNSGSEIVFCGSNCTITNQAQNCGQLQLSDASQVNCRIAPSTEPPIMSVREEPQALAVEFANQMRRKYPMIAGDKIGILIKEHNARVMANVGEFRQATQTAMFSFLDNLVECLADRCACCSLAGRATCLLKCTFDQASDNRSPISSKAPLGTAHCSASEGSSTGRNTLPRKRVYAETNGASCSRPPQRNEASGGQASMDIDEDADLSHIGIPESFNRLAHTIDKTVAHVLRLYIDIDIDKSCEDYVGFAQCTDLPMNMKNNVSGDLSPGLWSPLSITQRCINMAAQSIELWISNSTADTLASHWVIHKTPRFISIDGNSIQTELLGCKILSHESCAVLARRFAQMERASANSKGEVIWRKFMEPDFATLVMHNIDPRYVKSIRIELSEENEIEKCRMFVFPSITHDGWCVYQLDMLRKRIIVLDPRAGPFGYTTDMVKFHEFVSNKILACFFLCVKHFFRSWPCTDAGWSRSFPIVMSDKFPSEDHGICALFMASNHDGDSLAQLTTKDNIKFFRRNITYELMRIPGNESNIPAEALESIRSSLNMP